ncbi:MAG: DNA alkylation repair protein [archaeon]
MKKLRKELGEYSNPEKAKISQRFFKTGKGEYGEGDIFLGLTVPQQRTIAKSASERILLDDVEMLLGSEIHDERMVGLLILVDKYKRADKKTVYDFYLANIKGVNNWDLVDLSAPKIVGNYLLGKKDREILYELARSENLWERRIAIVSTFAFIREGEFIDSLKISKILLGDKQDLIHKAVGWMLREVGKKDREILEKFLKENYSELPRTTLRYAIERFGDEERKEWLGGC